MSSAQEKTRSRHYHGGAKGKLTGNTVQPAPAWRARNLPTESSDPGSKILFSNLPNDVSEEEIVDLMKKTIGPVNLRDSFMIYNLKGVPRGMAVIAFARGIDAPRARGRYNGKVIDGKRAVKIEIILDQDVDAAQPSIVTSNGAKTQVQQKPKSLFDRLSPISPSPNVRQSKGPPPNKRQLTLLERTRLAPPTAPPSQAQPPVAPRKRQKKGPKRVKKGLAEPVQKPVQKSVADLDREMEDYVAGRVNGEAPSMQSL